MSIVSSHLGEISITRNKARKGPVGRSATTDWETEPPPFKIGPELIQLHTRSFTRRPLPQDKHPITRVMGTPAKFLQEGSHAKGAALFFAPTPSHTTPVKVLRPTGFVPHHHVVSEYNLPPMMARDYSQGLRPTPRSLQPSAWVSPSEPAANIYRPAKEVDLNRRSGVPVNYHVAEYGLKAY